MFQSFDSPTSPEAGPPRLAALRGELAHEGLQGFLIPRADAHQGEYVAPRDDRLAWLTGFTGSAGFCIALEKVAGVFVDGRYRVQVKAQVDLGHFTPVDWPETKPGDWLKTQLPGGVVGFDPWLHAVSEIETLQRSLDGSGIGLFSSRATLRSMGGDVRMESCAGEGACACVEIPTAPVEAHKQVSWSTP